MGEKEDLEARLKEHPTFDPSIEQHIKCSNCWTNLYSVIPNNPYNGKKTIIIAKCWKCGDTSFEKTFKGDFYIGQPEETIHDDLDFTDAVYDKFGKIVTSTLILNTFKRE